MNYTNLSAMQTSELKTDIAHLESQYDHYNDLLDKAISKISDRLKKIRGLWEAK